MYKFRPRISQKIMSKCQSNAMGILKKENHWATAQCNRYQDSDFPASKTSIAARGILALGGSLGWAHSRLCGSVMVYTPPTLMHPNTNTYVFCGGCY